MGDIYYELKNYNEALNSYNDASGSEEAILKMGQIYEAVYDINNSRGKSGLIGDLLFQAIHKYEKIVGDLSSFPEIRHYSSNVNPRSGNAWFRLGVALTKAAEFEIKGGRPYFAALDQEKALFCFNKVIFLYSSYDSAYYQKGLLFEKMNKPYEAAQEYKKFINMANSAHFNYEDARQRLSKLQKEYGIM